MRRRAGLIHLDWLAGEPGSVIAQRAVRLALGTAMEAQVVDWQRFVDSGRAEFAAASGEWEDA